MTDLNTAMDKMAKRLAFLQIGDQTRATLRKLQPIVRAAIGPALDAFFHHIGTISETRGHFRDEAHMAGAKAAQAKHWDLIASGAFDETYLNAVEAVGAAHATRNVEPRWYIASYALVAQKLIEAVVAARWPRHVMGRSKAGAADVSEELGAIVKATFLDMELSISTYHEILERKTESAIEERRASAAHQAQALTILGRALSKLSDGDLECRIDEDLSHEFDEIKSDFNANVAQLRDIIGAVVDSISRVRSGTDEIGTASDDLSRRTEQQAANLEETSAALEQITTTVSHTAASTTEATRLVSATRSEAERGASVVQEAVDAMGRIENSSQQIGRVIGMIDEIAFQTNLLALNAGVEAARAGDAGRGFAVVAMEVRALAQKSADAAKEIKTLVTASTTQVAQGVDLVARTGEALTQIVAQVASIDAIVSDIAKGAREQAVGLGEVNAAINQLDRVTQQNAAMAEQATAAGQSVARETMQLENLASRFQFDKGSMAKAQGAPRRRVA